MTSSGIDKPIDLANGVRVRPDATLQVASRGKALPSPIDVIKNFKTKFRAEYNDSIPKAVCEELSYPEMTGVKKEKKRKPENRIEMTDLPSDHYDNIVEYDVDEEDLVWLNELNDRKGKEKLSIENHERMMDRLEKESYLRTRKQHGAVSATAATADADDVCCVCNDGDVSNMNQIIYCDMCNIAVHQDCYGVPYIPEGQWLCRRCKLSPSEAVQCALCPSRTGAFKQTSDGRWAHVICAIWLNEVHFGNAVFLEPVEGVDNSLRRRQRLRCMVCKKKMGACVQCSTRSCVRSFHVTCAQTSGMEMKTEAAFEQSAPDNMDIKRFVYCQLHETGSGSSPPDPQARKKKMHDAIRTARKALNSRKALRPTVSMPEIDLSRVAAIGERVGVGEEVMGRVHDYWFLKRKSRGGAPLIRRLLMASRAAEMAAAAASAAELPEECDEGAFGLYKSAIKRRQAMEMERMILEMVRKREEKKLEHLRTCLAAFEMLKPVDVLLVDAIDSLLALDKRHIFAAPVELDGYSSVIKKPIDLGTMRARAEAGEYSAMRELRADFELMCNNCDTFNETNPYFYKYGRKMRRSGNGILDEVEKRFNAYAEIPTWDSELRQLSAVCLEPPRLDNPKENELPLATPTASAPPTPAPPTPRATPVPSTPTTTAAPVAPIFGSMGGRTPAVPFNGFNAFTPRSKRKGDEAVGSQNKRRRKEENDPAQRAITSFFSSSPTMAAAVATPPDRRRSSLRSTTANTGDSGGKTFGAFRDNLPVASPLGTDTATSESSTDEDEGDKDSSVRENGVSVVGRCRRSARRLEMSAAVDADLGLFQHNDIVVIPSEDTAGRVVMAAVGGEVPADLAKELTRASQHEKDDLICVLLFRRGQEHWGWYNRNEVQLIAPDCKLEGKQSNSLTASLRLARNFVSNLHSN